MKHNIKCFHTKLSTKLSFFKVLAVHFYNSTNVVPKSFDCSVSLSFFTFVMQWPPGKLGFEAQPEMCRCRLTCVNGSTHIDLEQKCIMVLILKKAYIDACSHILTLFYFILFYFI